MQGTGDNMGKALFDDIAQFYDVEVKESISFKNDVPFYLKYAQALGGEVLELACGTGRALIPLAEQGIHITGLDASNSMLVQARKKIDGLLPEIQQRVELTKQDMTTFSLNKTFSLIFCTFRSFQHLVTKEEQAACLTRVHKHLQDNGYFIIDLFAPLHHLLAQQRRSIYLGTFLDPDTGHTISRRSEVVYNLAEQILHEDRFYEWTDDKGNLKRLVWSFDLAYMFRHEVELLLEKYGFIVTDVFGDFDKSPFNYYSGEQIFVARKITSQ